jgi:hypothetical protein
MLGKTLPVTVSVGKGDYGAAKPEGVIHRYISNQSTAPISDASKRAPPSFDLSISSHPHPAPPIAIAIPLPEAP